jgi:hypothetical protein
VNGSATQNKTHANRANVTRGNEMLMRKNIKKKDSLASNRQKRKEKSGTKKRKENSKH